ncbi:MAG: hypothetical protein C5B52_15740 [Bacteroidetes bacterium]|nr:MAG: hypothetical protein C5B52_15740 [Bacteroidota bacterium]
MVLGHFGFGLGAKKFAPKASLGTLFMAVQWADLLWPTFLLLGIEHVNLRPDNKKFPLEFWDYPITHSLLMSLVWGAIFGFIYWLIKKDKRSALVVGICVVSHWVLDLIVHQPDLPLFPGNAPKLGLGLWNWPVLTAVIEFSLFAIGLLYYLRTTRAKNARGKWGLWMLVILLVVLHIAGLLSPLPASSHAIGWAAQYQWIFVIMGYWVDRNRIV